MATLGHAEWFEEEAAFQLAGDLTGAGPAFLFRFIDALAAAGGASSAFRPTRRRGLRSTMVEGAAALAAASDDDPETLARRVASPGGTTEAGLDGARRGRALADLRRADARRRRGAAASKWRRRRGAAGQPPIDRPVGRSYPAAP